MSFVRFLNLLTRRKNIDDDLAATSLKRCLDVFDLTFLGIGATVGAGLYVVTGQIARDVAGPAIVLSFFVAAVAAFLSGICYSEFGCRVTKAGSAYFYTYSSLGEIWAFIIGWNMILEYVIGTASLGRASSEYIDSLSNGALHRFWMKHLGEWHVSGLGSYPDFLAFVLVLLVSGIVACGAKHSAYFNKAVTTINMLVVIFVITVGLFHVNPHNWSGKHQFAPYGVSGILAGAASCFYCFVGFDVIATASEETVNPKRAIPLAIMLCLTVSFLAYFGVATVLTLMVPYNELNKFAPLPEAFKRSGVTFAKYIIAVGGLCALAGSLMSGIFAVPRIIYAMAQDGLLFKFLGTVYSRTNVPLYAIIAAGLLSAVMSCLLDLKQLVEMLSIGTLLAYTLVSVSVLVLRFEPGIKDVTYDEVDIESSEKGYRIICCRTSKRSDYQMLKDLGVGLGSVTEKGEDKRKEDVDKSKPTPDAETSKIAKGSVALSVCALTGLVALIVTGWSALAHHEAWAIIIAVFCGLLIIFAVTVMQLQPKNGAKFPFTVPCIPWLPIASVTVNLFLLLKLSYWTWLRFAVWMVIGMTIYLAYGIRHSVEDERGEESETYYLIPQENDPQIEQTEKKTESRTETVLRPADEATEAKE